MPVSANAAGDTLRFDDLVLSLFQDIASAQPWKAFLDALCTALGACSASLVLRPPSQGDRGELFDVNTVRPLVEVYRSRSYEDDPFADLSEGVACTMYDLTDAVTLGETHYFRELLAPDRILDMLGLNVAFGDRHIGLFRVARRIGEPRFGLLERGLMARLYPHLRCALTAYDRERRHAIENRAYIRALDQLALGVVILDDRGEVLQFNETAKRLVDDHVFRIDDRRIRLVPDGEDAALQALVAANLMEAGRTQTALNWLRITQLGEPRAHLLLKPIYDEGDEQTRPLGVAIYVATTDRAASVTPAACATMFGLSRAEAALLLELLSGGSILSASLALGVSESTARTQLRSMFVKTGTHRQADLVRLVLTSLATIA